MKSAIIKKCTPFTKKTNVINLAHNEATVTNLTPNVGFVTKLALNVGACRKLALNVGQLERWRPTWETWSYVGY